MTKQVKMSELSQNEIKTIRNNTKQINIEKKEKKIQKFNTKKEFIKKDEINTTIEIYSTNDYSKFSILSENRDLNFNLIATLVLSMRKKLYFTYILVTKGGAIIDGQHRFFALKQLGLPINYRVVEDYEIEQIIALNLHKSWKTIDFIKTYSEMETNENRKHYKDLLYIINKYKFGSTRFAIMLCTNAKNQIKKKSCESVVKNGDFKILDYEHTIKQAEMMNDFSFLKIKNKKVWGKINFYIAMLNIFQASKYNHERMKFVLSDKYFDLTPSINIRGYIAQLCTMYNRMLNDSKKLDEYYINNNIGKWCNEIHLRRT